MDAADRQRIRDVKRWASKRAARQPDRRPMSLGPLILPVSGCETVRDLSLELG